MVKVRLGGDGVGWLKDRANAMGRWSELRRVSGDQKMSRARCRLTMVRLGEDGVAVRKQTGRRVKFDEKEGAGVDGREYG